MQMIRGTDILLGQTTVRNVLIGEPSADGREYVLAIPKGDTNVWTDTVVTFWGRRWRTLGLPGQGMDENIPLSWNKKVRVQALTGVQACTVYEGGSKQRHIFADALITDTRGRALSASGAVRESGMKVRIFSHNVNDYIPKTGDIIVAGECDLAFDTATQQSESNSMASLRALCPGLAFVVSSELTMNGLLYDIDITAG